MLKPLMVTLTLAGVSGCVFNDQKNPPRNLYQTPAAMGELVLTDSENETYRCQATLVTEDYILTGAHCYADPKIIQAEFISNHPSHSEIRQSVNLPDSKERLKNKNVSIFYQDAVLLSLEDNIYDITPLSIKHDPIKPVDDLHYVSFPQPQGYSDSVKGWQACHFDPQEANPKLWLSEDCVLSKGYSGMPLLTYENENWVIVGMYHAYLISRDKKTGDIKKAFGAASPASSWRF